MGFEYRNRYYGDSRFKDEFYNSKESKSKNKNQYENDIVFCGTFSIMTDNKVYDYKIGENISENDKLILNVISANKGDKVILKSGDIGKLIKKNIYGKIKRHNKKRKK